MKLILTFIAACMFATQGYCETLKDQEFQYQRLEEVFLQEAITNWIVKSYPKNTTLKTAETISRSIIQQSKVNRIKFDFLVGVIALESGFKVNAVSREGAKGLMQVIPKYHKAKIKGRSLFDPKVGIEVGTAILKDCLVKFNYRNEKALACYSGSTGKQATRYYQTVLAKSKLFQSHLTLALFSKERYLVSVNEDHQSIIPN